jgi:hypothetical protein
MYKLYLKSLKKIINNSDDFFKITLFLVWQTIYLLTFFLMFEEITFLNACYSAFVTFVLYFFCWGLFFQFGFFCLLQEKQNNILKNYPQKIKNLILNPQILRLFLTWIFSILARSVFYFLVGRIPTAESLHNNLSQFAGEEKEKKFWLLYETADALGLSNYILAKSSNSNVINRYTLLYFAEQVGISIKIKEDTPYLWCDILKDLEKKVANVIAKKRHHLFKKLYENTIFEEDLCNSKNLSLYSWYEEEIQKIINICGNYTGYCGHIYNWFGADSINLSQKNILSQDFVVSGDYFIPRPTRDEYGFLYRDPNFKSLKMALKEKRDRLDLEYDPY